MARPPTGASLVGKSAEKKGDYYYTGNERVPGKRGGREGGCWEKWMEMGRIGWHEGIDYVRGEGAWRLAREDRARRGC